MEKMFERALERLNNQLKYSKDVNEKELIQLKINWIEISNLYDTNTIKQKSLLRLVRIKTNLAYLKMQTKLMGL